MKISKHIAFYFIHTRINFLNKIIAETNKYPHLTDIFIHTNSEYLLLLHLDNYTNGKIKIIYHDLTGINPHYLTWKCRDLLKQQRHEYDIFMYIEDDILVPFKAINYWITYNEKLIQYKYNLGFVRIEIGTDGSEYITDLQTVQLRTFAIIDKQMYCVNNINTYCAFWIYNRQEFNRFVDSLYYDINNIIYRLKGQFLREKSGYGLHGPNTDWYINTLIPITDKKLIDDCKIYHMGNNYVNDDSNDYATIKFSEALKFD